MRRQQEQAAHPALRVSSDVLARDGFTCRGELRLNNAEIGGSLHFEGATLDNPDGTALSALDLRVGANAHLCEGFTASGAIRLVYAKVTSSVCLERATLSGAGTALDCCSSDHPRAGVAARPATRRCRRPQSRPDRAAPRRPGDLTVYLQDLTVGYGYRPVRAVAWLAALLVLGTGVFTLSPPRAAEPSKAPEFVAFIYTLDLILPAIAVRTARRRAGWRRAR